MSDVLTLEIEARVNNLEAVIAFVDQILEENDCPMKTQMQIDIAVEEIFVNICHYAYTPDVGNATIKAHLVNDGRTIEVTFIDTGVAFDPLAKPDPDVSLSADKREIGGLGIYMVKKSMDEVAYTRDADRNVFTLWKDLV